jgi:hypothetical protein
MSGFDIEVVTTLPLSAADLLALSPDRFNVLLVELDDQLDHMDPALFEILEDWEYPLLFNEIQTTKASFSQPDRLDYGRELSRKLHALVPHAPQSVA